MTRGEDKPIAIQPAGFRRIVTQGVSKKDRAYLSATQRKPEMSGGTGVNGIHGEAAGFSCGALQVGD